MPDKKQSFYLRFITQYFLAQTLMTPELVLGIDGGGTKTAAWLATVIASAEDRPLGVGQAGPGNMRAVGFETALGNMDAAIAAAFADAKLPRTTVTAACFGLAGADRPSEQQPLREWAEQRRIARKLILTNDAEPLIAAGSAENWGVAIISGTGSFGFGRSQSGETARCGGWGYLLGDEGSGYSIAVAGLRAVARAVDGRGHSTRLVDLFQHRLGLTTPAKLVEAIYGTGGDGSSLSRQRIADLADAVFQASAENDSVATSIVLDAGRELALLVQTLVNRLTLPRDSFPLSLAGGILHHQPSLRDAIDQVLSQAGYNPGQVTIVTEPVRGAIALARRAA